MFKQLMTDYKYKYIKYKTKYLQLKGGVIDKEDKEYKEDNKLECEFIKFPDWIVKMSNKYPNSVDYSKFTVMKESLYSSELPFHIEKWKRIVSNIIDDKPSKAFKALDMTANIGGFSINIASLFKNLKIVAVEMDRCSFLALQKNIEAFNLQDRVTAVNKDSLKLLKDKSILDHKFDFIVVDPPWGGTGYKSKEKLQLKLSNKDIHGIVKYIFKKGLTNTVLLKAPTNFDNRFNNRYTVVKTPFMKPNGRDVSYYVYIITNNKS